MNILVIAPLEKPALREIDGSLAAMQRLVGGTIQAVYPFEEPVALVCHDEGKLLGLPLNRALYHPETGELCDVIAGTFFLCGAPPGSGDFASLTGEQIRLFSRRFARPEVIVSLGARDYPVVQGCVLVFAIFVMVVNLLVDVCYKWIDPRIALE